MIASEKRNHNRNYISFHFSTLNVRQPPSDRCSAPFAAHVHTEIYFRNHGFYSVSNRTQFARKINRFSFFPFLPYAATVVCPTVFRDDNDDRSGSAMLITRENSYGLKTKIPAANIIKHIFILRIQMWCTMQNAAT